MPVEYVSHNSLLRFLFYLDLLDDEKIWESNWGVLFIGLISVPS